ncbi:MAG TPA: NUDIX hydrolase [Euzebya sp.]|nr:NUDIX hydrolase [Euzebya sp.]
MSDPTTPPEVRAAGGVVWRPHDLDTVHVLLVHRPRYDDWSLPKGKLDDGEDFATAAVREIAEETGVTGHLGPDLGEVRYIDHRGRPKVVRWWALEAVDVGPPDDTDEVDELRWLPLEAAGRLLTYPTDVEVLGRFRGTVLA